MWNGKAFGNWRAAVSGRDAQHRRKLASILFFAATMLAIVWRFVLSEAD
jgi:hypothetical protein